MKKGITREAEVIEFRESIAHLLRRRVLEAIELVLEEELTQALGSERYARCRWLRGSA